MKILHFGDQHLRDKDIDEITRCLDFIVETAKQERPDLIISAGDFFHSQDIKLDSLSAKLAIRIVSELADIAPVAIVRGTPSHDGMAPEIFCYARGKHDIHVSVNPEQIYLHQGSFYMRMVGNLPPEAIIALIPPPTKQWFQSSSDISGVNQEIGEAMSGLFLGFGAQAAEYRAPHILVGHFNVSGAKLSNGQVMTGRDIEVSVDQMAMTGADLHLLGHIHYPQQLGDRTFYASSIYPENVGENHAHGFYIHEFPKTPMGVFTDRFIETPCRKLVRFKVDFTEEIGVERDFDLASDGWTDGDGIPWMDLGKGGAIRMDVTAYQDEVGKIDKEAIRQFYLAAGAESVDIRITPVPRVTVRAAEVLKAETLRSKIEQRAKLTGDELAPEVLSMADLLENSTAESLLVFIAGGQG